MRIEGVEAERFFAVVRRAVEKFGSQSAAAERLGISQSYVSRVLKGKSAAVQRSTLDVVGLRLGVPAGHWGDGPKEDAESWADSVLSTTHDGIAGKVQSTQNALGALAVQLVKANVDSEDPARIAEMSRELAAVYKHDIANVLAARIAEAKDDVTAAALGFGLAQVIVIQQMFRLQLCYTLPFAFVPEK